MILSYHTKCACGHPLNLHIWFPSNMGEWPVGKCEVEKCGCGEFCITFFMWSVYTLLRKYGETIEDMLVKLKKVVKRGRLD